MKLIEIERCRVIAARRFGVDPEVTVDWSQQGLNAGHCHYEADGKSRIRLNAKIAAAEGDRFIQTIAHEYAHAVAWAIRHRQGYLRVKDHHGRLWQSIMNAFGYPAERCHSYESAVAVRHVEKFRYRCGCGPVQLVGPKVHGKIQKGAYYFCRKCKGKLIQEGVMTAEQLLAQMLSNSNGDEE